MSKRDQGKANKSRRSNRSSSRRINVKSVEKMVDKKKELVNTDYYIEMNKSMDRSVDETKSKRSVVDDDGAIIGKQQRQASPSEPIDTKSSEAGTAPFLSIPNPDTYQIETPDASLRGMPYLGPTDEGSTASIPEEIVEERAVDEQGYIEVERRRRATSSGSASSGPYDNQRVSPATIKRRKMKKKMMQGQDRRRAQALAFAARMFVRGFKSTLGEKKEEREVEG